MTILILGFDGLDPQLVEEFDCSSLTLETAGAMETLSHMKDVPLTQEIWPTIATGLHPAEHGITGADQSEWDNPVVNLLSNFTHVFSSGTRGTLGDLASAVTGASYATKQTEVDSLFDGEAAFAMNWPGVTDDRLKEAWNIATPHKDDSVARFNRELRCLGIQSIAWLEELSRHPVAVGGVHVHVPDLSGHVFAEDREHLAGAYQWLDERTAEFREAMGEDDELLIVSDHGMVTPWSPDGDLANGEHSFKAYSASTLDSRPRSVLEVREWVERHAPDVEADDETFDLPEEQLRDLGYIE
jgi:hypothetical protein